MYMAKHERSLTLFGKVYVIYDLHLKLTFKFNTKLQTRLL
jgi:hypothetical protein